jgi:hypothetical protein
MKLNKIIFFFLIGASFFLVNKASAATYYVRPDGHNTASGLNNNSNTTSGAWLTLQHAADEVAAGDTVYVADGSYAGFMLQTSGTVDAPITFAASGSGANIVSRNPTTTDGINIESYDGGVPNYIIIDGFRVYNQTRMGIRLIGGTGIIVRNTVVHDNGDCGIFSGNTPHLQVLNNVAYSNGDRGTEHNIYISNAESDYPIVRGNMVYNAGGGNGIQLNGDWQEGGDGYIDGAIVENNIVYGNAAKGLSLISIRNGTIQNNVIYGNGRTGSAGGIHIVEQLSSHYSSNNVVVNNTIDETLIVAVRINSGNTGNVVFNNVTIGGVVFEGTGNYQSNNNTATSGFTDRSGHVYTLLPTSTNIDGGLATYRNYTPPATDFTGKSRPIAGGYDIGAYEAGEVGTQKTGDLNSDNAVDILDYNLLVSHFGQTGSGVVGDIDANNKVDIFDFNLLIGNFGR